MYFSVAISMYQRTKVAFKIALFLEFFQSVKTRILRALLTEVKMQFLAMFLHPCDAIMIPNMHVKDHFD